MMTFKISKSLWQWNSKKIKQQIAEIKILTKTKPPVKHPTSRNKENFMNSKLSGKPSYTNQSTLMKDKERKKQKRPSFPAIKPIHMLE